MSLISILDEKLVLIYEKLLPTGFWSLLKDRGFECISASEKDFMYSNGLCLNVLALSPSNLIMVDGFDDTKKRLEDAGCNVVTFDGSELCIKAEGGPTCLTRPIYRS
jgi:N-dimethylarginine dimethylaminohydrolase